MADNIPVYLDILGSNAGALSNISALLSLDATIKKNDASIKTMEKSWAAAKDAATQASAKQDWAAAGKATQAMVEANNRLTVARQKQQLAVAKQDLYAKGLDKQVEAVNAAKAAESARAANSRGLLGALEAIKGNVGNLAEQAKGAGGPVGSLVGKLEALGKGGAVGAAIAIVATLGALAAAAVVAAVALTRYAFAQADAARTSKLFSEAALGSAAAATELETVVDQMSNVAPGLSVKLKEIGRDFEQVNLRGRNAQLALQAFATVATAGGEAAAGKIKAIADASGAAQKFIIGARDRFGEFLSLKGSGIKAGDLYSAFAKASGKSVAEAKRLLTTGVVPLKQGLEALALAADAKLGGVAARQMMSLSNQAEKLKENISKLFTGANIEPFLAGLKTVTDLFSQDTVTGYVLRQVFTAAFTKIAAVAAQVFPYVAAAIKGVVAGVLIFADVAKKAYVAISVAFGGSSMSKADKLALAFRVGAMAVGAVVGAVAGLALAIVALGAVAVFALAPVWVPFALMAAMIYVGIKAIGAIVDEIDSLAVELKDIDLSSVGKNIVAGLVKGIKSAIHDVKDAMREISEAVTGTITTDQKVQSPSRKQKEIGGHIGEGLAIGITNKKARVEDAGMELSGGASRGISNGTRGELGAHSSSTTFSPQFTNCIFGSSRESVETAFEELWVAKMQWEARRQ